jgi:hypothetical protein
LDRNASSIPGPYYNIGPFSIQTLSINFIQHCFCDLGSHFEALKSVLLIFFLGFASKKYDQTDSRAPKCLPRVTKTVMYIVKSWISERCTTWGYKFAGINFAGTHERSDGVKLTHDSQFDHIFSRQSREKILVKLTRGPQNDSRGHKNSVA